MSELDKKMKSNKNFLARFRGWIQAAATLLTNIHIPNLFKGKIYQGNVKTMCVPGLNCYSCPAATGACPIGAFQAVVGSSKFKFTYYITGFFILLGVLLGRYHKAMEALNVLPPSIEPHASGHIIEQIELVEEILKNGYAYESEGSVYFDVAKYNKDHHYGKLSGRNLDDVLNTTRELDGQSEKRNPADFALWKCAQPEHIMRWPSPWSNGFPGWHCECTAMGKKYLGEHFDIHGGGMDLIFPHHECEIAQSVASQGDDMVHYWMHNNMITINGQKMGKSYGNFINLDEFFHGTHKLLTQAYSPMTIRFFILQAHYRSTVDFSNEALQAAEKGLERLTEAVKGLERITPATQTTGIEGVKDLREKCYTAMNDDLNSPIVIAHLFDGARMINTVLDKKATISAEDLEELKSVFHLFMYEILGLKEEAANNDKVTNQIQI